MPQFGNVPPYKKSKSVEIEWDSWKDGFNSLFRATELKPTEMAQADNIPPQTY